MKVTIFYFKMISPKAENTSNFKPRPYQVIYSKWILNFKYLKNKHLYESSLNYSKKQLIKT